MADYIDTNILCEAYLHIGKDLGSIPEKRLKEIEIYLKDFTSERARLFLYEGTDTEIEFIDGSIKSYVKILGTVSALYAGIANYPSFREGIKFIYADAKRFSEYITSEVLFKLNSKSTDILRIEARVGVIGSIYKIVNKLERLQNMFGDSDISRTNNLFLEIMDDIRNLNEVIQNKQDKKLLKTGFLDMSRGIPEKPRQPEKRKHPMSDAILYIRRRKRLIEFIDRLT